MTVIAQLSFKPLLVTDATRSVFYFEFIADVGTNFITDIATISLKHKLTRTLRSRVRIFYPPVMHACV